MHHGGDRLARRGVRPADRLARGGCGKPEMQPNSLTARRSRSAAPIAPLPHPPADRPGGCPSRSSWGRATPARGTVLPSFFAVDSDLRPFSPAGVGATVASERARLLSPVGSWRQHRRLRVGRDATTRGRATPRSCSRSPGASEPRPVAFGGCLVPAATRPARTAARWPPATGSRRSSAAAAPPARTAGPRPSSAWARRRRPARARHGTYRRPRGVAAAGDRVAWWQPACAGGREIVVQQGAEPRLRAGVVPRGDPDAPRAGARRQDRPARAVRGGLHRQDLRPPGRRRRARVLIRSRDAHAASAARARARSSAPGCLSLSRSPSKYSGYGLTVSVRC